MKTSKFNNEKRLSVKIDGIGSSDVNIKLNTGENLGLIQSLDLNCSIGNFNTVKLTSILEKAEVDILQKNTELKVILPYNYKIGYWINFLFNKVFPKDLKPGETLKPYKK